jgi:hypothetical protein
MKKKEKKRSGMKYKVTSEKPIIDVGVYSP